MNHIWTGLWMALVYMTALLLLLNYYRPPEPFSLEAPDVWLPFRETMTWAVLWGIFGAVLLGERAATVTLASCMHVLCWLLGGDRERAHAWEDARPQHAPDTRPWLAGVLQVLPSAGWRTAGRRARCACLSKPRLMQQQGGCASSRQQCSRASTGRRVTAVAPFAGADH